MATALQDEIGVEVDEQIDAQAEGDQTEQTETDPQEPIEAAEAIEEPKPERSGLYRDDDSQWLKRIAAQEQRVSEAKRNWIGLKVDTKEAKEQLEEEVADLLCLIRAYRNDQDRPLLNMIDGGAATEKAEEAASITVSTDETWRATTIDQLGFAGRIAKALTEAELLTLGSIADYTKQYMLTSIKGIGETAAQEIEDRLTDYWAQNPVGEPGAVADDDPDADDESDLDDEE